MANRESSRPGANILVPGFRDLLTTPIVQGTLVSIILFLTFIWAGAFWYVQAEAEKATSEIERRVFAINDRLMLRAEAQIWPINLALEGVVEHLSQTNNSQVWSEKLHRRLEQLPFSVVAISVLDSTKTQRFDWRRNIHSADIPASQSQLVLKMPISGIGRDEAESQGTLIARVGVPGIAEIASDLADDLPIALAVWSSTDGIVMVRGAKLGSTRLEEILVDRILGNVNSAASIVSENESEILKLSTAAAMARDPSFLAKALRVQSVMIAAAAVTILLIISGLIILYLVRSRASLINSLEETENRLRDFAEASSEWLWETDANYQFIYISPWTVVEGGVNPKNLIGTSQIDLVSEGSQAEVSHRRLVYLETHRPFRDFVCRWNWQSASPNYISMSGKPFFAKNGNFLGYRGTGRDITHNIKAETRLVAAVRRLREPVLLFDANDRLVLVNEAFTQMMPGLEALAVIGTEYRSFLSDLLQTEFMPDAKGRESLWLDRQLERHKNRSNDRVETRVYGDRWMVFDEQRLEEGETIILGVDITENKKNEMVLREAKMAADAANNAKSKFLANMSHELRTPLNAIIGFSEIIHDEVFGPLGNSKYKSYSADIKNSAEHLFGIIADLLDMSRIEAGRMETEPESFRAADVVHEVVRMVGQQARDSDLTLESEVSKASLMVYADRRMLIQILINLLSNSIKFTNPDGKIKLTAVPEQENVIFIVSDNGIGIAEEDCARVLKPFEQAGTVMKDRYRQGTGLGLPLSASLAQLNSGALSLKSELGLGTEVRIQLPQNPPLNELVGLID